MPSIINQAFAAPLPPRTPAEATTPARTPPARTPVPPPPAPAAAEKLPDAVLMQRASGGDTGAFAAIYDRHAAAALGLACRMIRPQAAAEDVVQEAFLALWRSDSYQPVKGSVRGFLLRIVHNGAIDSLRRERSRGAGRHVDEALAHPLAADDSVHLEVERAEAARHVRDALATLPESQQRSLELAYFGGLSHVEIARAVGAPIGTVKSRLRLGLEKLRDRVDLAYCD